jgi:hypothetical protein
MNGENKHGLISSLYSLPPEERLSMVRNNFLAVFLLVASVFGGGMGLIWLLNR